MFELTFLGTSAGVPTKQRNVSGLAIESINPYLSGDKQRSQKNRPWVLVDCGEGTQHQLLKTNVSLLQLQVIFITHVHGDHCYGLAGLLASMAMAGRKSSLKIVAPRAIAKLLDTLTITTELYFCYPIEFITIEDLLTADKDTSDKETPDSNTADLTIEFTPTHILQVNITALSHRSDSYAFSLEQQINRLRLNTDKLRAEGIPAGVTWGKLQQGLDVEVTKVEGINANDDKNATKHLKSADYVIPEQSVLKIVVSGDNDTPELLTEAVKGAKLLVHESTYTQDVADKIKAKEQGIDPMHSTAKQVAMFASSTQLENIILTHISARYQSFDDPTSKKSNIGHLRAEVADYYQGNYWIANDFDKFMVYADKDIDFKGC